MRPLDWIVVVAYVGWIIIDGLRRSKGTDKVDGYLLANRSLPWWAVGLSVMATQMSAVTIVGTTGLAYSTGLRFIQNYFPLPLAMVILSLTVVPFFTRARVYTAYEYLERRFDVRRPLAGELPLSDRPRRLARRHPGRAVGRDVGDSRLVAAGDRARDLHPDDRLHHDRRRPGGGLDRRQADVHRRLRHVGRGGHPAVRNPAARGLRPGAPPGGRDRPVEGGGLQLQPQRDLHVLVGDARRHVPDALVLRLRPEPGAALPDGEIDRRSAPVADDERLGQDPAAAADPHDRRAGVRVLPVQHAADAVQPRLRRAGGGEPARGGIRRAAAGSSTRRSAARGARRHVGGSRRRSSRATRGSRRSARRRSPSSSRRPATTATTTSTTCSRPSSPRTCRSGWSG